MAHWRAGHDMPRSSIGCPGRTDDVDPGRRGMTRTRLVLLVGDEAHVGITPQQRRGPPDRMALRPPRSAPVSTDRLKASSGVPSRRQTSRRPHICRQEMSSTAVFGNRSTDPRYGARRIRAGVRRPGREGSRRRDGEGAHGHCELVGAGSRASKSRSGLVVARERATPLHCWSSRSVSELRQHPGNGSCCT